MTPSDPPKPDLPKLVADLETLARLESPSNDLAAVEAVLDQAQAWAEALGGVPERLTGGSRRIRFGDGDRPLLLLGHADTVWPHGTLEGMPLRRDGDRLRGPGVADMKGGIVSALHALELLEGKWPQGGIELLLTPDEEVGSAGSREHIEAAARRARAALVLEPPVEGTNALKTARKGVGEWTLDFAGLAAHAGNDPAKGASALSEAARALLALEALARPEQGSTVSVGHLEGGGPVNVIPARAALSLDVRFSGTEEAERLSQAIPAYAPHDARVTVSARGGINRPPFERGEGTARLFALAQSVASEHGWALSEAGVGGGSDGNFTAPLCPTLDGLGAPGGGLHAAHEFVDLNAWPRHVALLAELLRRIP